MKTKMSLILLGLVCNLAYAAHSDETPMPVSNDINVTAPAQSGSWSFGAMAVLMEPTNAGYTYANQYDYSLDSRGNDPIYQSSTPLGFDEPYHWWFSADVRYAFPGHGRDVILAYEGLHGSTSASASNNPDDMLNANEYRYLLNVVTQTNVDDIQATSKTQYDAGDLLFGQKFDVGQRIQLHPFLGLRYARIAVQMNFEDDFGSDPSAGEGGTENGVEESTFSGIGPRFGSDATVNLGQGFSIRGRLGLSALIGPQQYNESFQQIFYLHPSSGGIEDYPAYYKQDPISQTRIIPEIDARLGLNYSYHFESKTALGIEAGWQALNYFQAVDNPPDEFALGETGASLHEDYSNFGLQGPYARIQLDVA